MDELSGNTRPCRTADRPRRRVERLGRALVVVGVSAFTGLAACQPAGSPGAPIPSPSSVLATPTVSPSPSGGTGPGGGTPSTSPSLPGATGSPGQCQTPQADVTVAPGDSIQRAVDDHPPGTSFLLAAGVHRLATVEPKQGDLFYGELAPDCTRLTTLNGARVLTGFVRSGALWAVAGQDQQGQVHGECEDGWDRCNRPEDLYLDNRPLRHVGSAGEVGAGTWFFDYDADTVYLGDDPAGHVVEIGTARNAFGPTADGVTVRGLVIEKYAIPPQMGAIGDQYPASGWHIEDNEVRLNHGTGLNAGPNTVVRNNSIHDNGQKGIGAGGSGVLVDGNEIAYNIYAHVAAGWEAGGTKFANTTGLVVSGNCVHHNGGPGLWTDINNTGARYEDNTVFSNDGEGIFHEISMDVEIRDNRVGHNGRVNPGWLYGANILVSTSSNANVTDNYVEVDAEFGNGIAIIWQNRPPYVGTGSTVSGNEVTFLGGGGQTGAAADFAPATTDVFTTNSFGGNTYHVSNPADPHFAWANTAQDFAGFQAHGQDTGGNLDTTATARTWSCDMP